MDEMNGFQLEEYKALRVEIDNIQKQGYVIESSLILGLAAAIGFSLKDDQGLGAWPAFALLCVVLLATLKKLFLSRRMKLISNYIKLIEKDHCKKSTPGWEHFLSLHENKGKKHIGLPSRIFFTLICFTATIFWIQQAW